ncbi:hypothetical protein Cni_G27439 [Canna indica]|uniref:Cation/H+ exchanger transmembrane domain-containing protein n=1 Tax=Canna indica TaxID=4628 RepID=A0AAQ3L0U0_9LILI|nr:hypothetical protein Cni_G27439 [Canna indica]
MSAIVRNIPRLFNISDGGDSSDTICCFNGYVNSKGVFLDDNPFEYSVPLLLFDISFFLAANTTHYTGILLGPSVIGQSETFRRTLFLKWVHLVLDVISLVSLAFFMFTVGVKTNLSLLRKPRKHSLAIGAASSILPFALTLSLYYLLKPSFPNNLCNSPLLFMITARLSFSSFPVLAPALGELQLLNSELGLIVMSASLVSDIADWVVSTLATSWTMLFEAKTPVAAVGIIASVVSIVLFLMFVVRPSAKWSVSRMPAGEAMAECHFTLLMLAALLMSFVTQTLGLNLSSGADVDGKAGAAMHGLVLALSVVQWGVIELVVLVCFFSKLIGTVVMYHYLHMSMNDAFSLGLMLNNQHQGNLHL